MSWEPMKEGISPPHRSERTAGIRWQPRFGYYDRLWRSDVLRCFFAPLIAADQQWIHCQRHDDGLALVETGYGR